MNVDTRSGTLKSCRRGSSYRKKKKIDEGSNVIEEENHDWNIITENIEAKSIRRCVDVKKKACEKPNMICKKTNRHADRHSRQDEEAIPTATNRQIVPSD
jgi:hypothetical protein